jgi:hypothetical protein
MSQSIPEASSMSPCTKILGKATGYSLTAIGTLATINGIIMLGFIKNSLTNNNYHIATASFLGGGLVLLLLGYALIKYLQKKIMQEPIQYSPDFEAMFDGPKKQ